MVLRLMLDLEVYKENVRDMGEVEIEIEIPFERNCGLVWCVSDDDLVFVLCFVVFRI